MKVLIASFPIMAAALFVVACLPEAPAGSMTTQPSAYSMHLEEIGPTSRVQLLFPYVVYVPHIHADQIMSVLATYKLSKAVPLADSSVPDGFPTLVEDYVDRALDFNEPLIENAAATLAT